MANLWNTLLLHPFINMLIALDRFTGNLGWSIILMTVALRLLMTPIILPSLRLSKKMQELAPQLAALKEKYKDDKTALLNAQTQLYKEHGANPASGCLPQIVQLVVLIALYSALNTVLSHPGPDLVAKLNPLLYPVNRLASDYHLSTSFMYLDLTKPDVFRLPSLGFPLPGIFLILAALVQLIN